MKDKGLENMPVVNSKEVKKLIDFLRKESKGHTEFRLVVHEDGNAYSHVLGRDSETVNFKLKENNR